MSQARLFVVVWSLCVGLAGAGFGQGEDTTRGHVELFGLVEAVAGRNANVNLQDPVWDLRPANGQKLLLLPMVYQPGESSYSVSRPEVSPRTGRFIAFYIPGDRDRSRGHSNDGSSKELATLLSGDSEAISKMLLSQPVDEQQRRELERQQQELARQEAEREALEGGLGEAEGTPEFAPRLTRSIQIQPDGMIQWEVDRSIVGGEPKQASEQNLYGYVINPAAVQELEPERPERAVRRDNEDARDFANRRREEQQAYRDEVDEFRDLRQRIRDLPGRFTEPLPDVVYAVFLVNDTETLELQGPDPYPWTLTKETAESLQQLAQARGGGGRQDGLPVEISRSISVMRNVLAAGHPLSYRAVAMAAYKADLPGMVETNDAGYRLIDDLLACEDELARQITLAAIAQTHPPTRASAALLGKAAEVAPEDLRQALELSSLRAMFAIDVKDPANALAMSQRINDALRNEQGPTAGRIIEELLDALDREGVTGNARRGSSGPGEADALDVILINRIELKGAPESQWDAMIAQIIRRSPDNRIAAGWLDRKLLRSGEDALVDRTLTLLSQADAGSTLIKPLTADLRGLVFGAPPEGANTDRIDLTLEQPIALTGSDHGIIASLNSTDPARTSLAWQVLRHFEIHADQLRSSPEQGTGPALIFDQIVDSGLKREPTPLYLIDFVDNQSEGQLADHAAKRMNQLLLMDIDPAAAKRAARAYVASAQRYTRPMSQMQPLERSAVVQQLYLLTQGNAPLVTGLSVDEQGTYTRWFAEYLTQHNALPDERAWATAFSEDQLIRSAATSDLTLRSAAAAALVIAAGGDQSDQTKLLNALSKTAEPTVQTVTEAWTPIKQAIYAEVLADAAGKYRFVLIQRGDPSLLNQQPQRGFGQQQAPTPEPPSDLAAPAPAAPQGDVDQPVLKEIELGIVDLNVDGTNVSLSLQSVAVAVPVDQLAIRLNHVSTLTEFNNQDLAQLPLSQLNYSLNLLPDGNGGWSGAMALPNGTTLQVIMRPE